MRALSVSEGLNPDKIVRAAMAELQTHASRSGGTGDSFLVIEVRTRAYDAEVSEPAGVISPGRS